MLGLYRTSGFSIVNIPICANMQNTSLSGDTYLSGISLFKWNKDISIAKIGVRIPIESAFPFDGEEIKIVYDDNNPPSVGTMTELGSFTTKTSATVSGMGEWSPLDYTPNMYEDQYEYFINPSNIYAYSEGHTLAVSGGSLPLSGEYLTGMVSPTSAYTWLGGFELRVFYDQVRYSNKDFEIININSSANDQNNSINRVITGDGYVEFEWISGSFVDQFGNNLTTFNVSANNIEYYGDKNNLIKFSVSDSDIIALYINSSDSTLNSGELNVKYIKENY